MSGHLGRDQLIRVAALAAPLLLLIGNEPCSAALAGDSRDTSPFVVRSWQVEDGLPHNSVNAILQTRDGYLWLATDDGLARFDGVRFTVFGLREGLPSLQVLALLEDRNGALWIGTSRGLSRLQNGQFDTWTTKDGLAGNEVTTLVQDQEGSIWAGTVTGLGRWRNGKFTTFGKAEGLNDKRVRALAANRKGGIWASMIYEWLFQWNGSRFVMMDRRQAMPEAPPNCLLQDRSGRLWAGTARGTIFCFENGQWRRYGREQGLPATPVVQLIEGTDGTLWAALGGGGLYSLTKGGSPAVWRKADFPREGVVSLLEDQEQNLWVGTRAQGLTRLKPKRISILPIQLGDAQAAPRTMAQTPDGVLWVGTSSHGLFRIQDGKLDPFLRDAPVRDFPYVSAVLATRDGSLWWGTGPALFQWKEGKLVSAYTNEFRSWLREDRIRVLSEDQDGGIWLGTQNGQLRVLRAGQFIALTNWQSAVPLTALLRQADGTLLVGTYGNGVICVRDGKCSPLIVQNSQQMQFICTLYEDSNRVLWIGTEGAGLTRLEAGRASTLTTRNGLLNDTIVQILEDDAGSLWLGSYRGVLRISQEELRRFAQGETAFVHPLILGRSDGLPSEQCMRGFNAGFKTREGLLHFSTDPGIAVINPHQQPVSASPPTVWLEKVLVDGEAYYARIQSGAQIQVPAGQAATRIQREHLTIPPGKRRLEFQYTGLSLGAPESVRFRYQLEGLDDRWIEAGRERLAFYSLLPAGDYQFHVTACDNSGVWSPQEAVLSFEVEPFFWQTWWFRLGLLTALVASVVSAVRYVSYRRLRLRLRTLEQETAVQKDRARIAKDLHDDLGAHLSQIAMLSELAQSDFDKPAQAKGHIDLIFRTARSVTRSLDEIVWAVNPRNDSLDRFTAQLCTFAPEFLRAAGISCRLDVPMDLPSVPLPSKVRHHLYLGFKEALHNVVKHAGATEVWLRLKIDSRQLTLVIEDNGRGFQLGAGAATGEDGLVNLGQRMSEIGGSFQQQSEPGQGTRTVLVAPLEPGL
jgi:ligand-binding sensor domain-containing protein/signal transduction histidine kinase